MNKSFQRKSFITSDPAQIKILSLLLISILVPVFFVGSFLYLLIFKILSEQPSIPGYVPIALNSIVNRTNVIIMTGFIPLLLLLFIWGVVVSNRITGPLSRLQRELDAMSKGSAKTPLSVRKFDYIAPLVNSINKLLTK